MSSSNPTIALTFPFSLGLDGGGPKDCINTAIALAQAGATVFVLPVQTRSHDSFPRAEIPIPAFESRQRRLLGEAGVQVIPVSRNPLHFILDANAVRRELRKLLVRHKIDAVISYWQEGRGVSDVARQYGAIHGILAAASYRQWLYGTARKDSPGKSLKSLVKKFTVVPLRKYLRQPIHHIRSQAIVGDAIRKADFLIARSDFTRQELVDLFDADYRKVTIAHCGVDGLFQDCSRTYSATPMNIIYVGALVSRKGVFDAIEAFSRLRSATQRDFQLRIAGWGGQAAIRTLLRERQLDCCVTVLGGLDQSRLIEELQWADVALLPSYSESFGLAVAEAQATGLPVVAYSAGAVPEVVENGQTGWLAPVGNVAALADLLQTALQSPSVLTAAGEAAASRIRSRFTWDASAAKIIETIGDARANGNPYSQ